MDIGKIFEKRSITNPLPILLYVFFIGSINYFLRILLSRSLTFSLIIYYIDIAAVTLFFFLILIIYKIAIPQLSFDMATSRIAAFFWILSFTPLFTIAMGGQISPFIIKETSQLSTLIIFDSINSGLPLIVLLFGILTTISIYIDLDKKSLNNFIQRCVVPGLLVIFSSLPIFFIDRVKIIINYSHRIVLYEVFKLKISAEIYEGISHPSPRFYTYIALNQAAHLYLLILLFESLILCMLVYYIFNKTSLLSILKNIKPFRTIHFAIMVIIGMIIVHNLNPEHALSLNTMHLPFIFLPIICMILTWQFTAILNDYWDTEIDSIVHPGRPLITGDIPKERYLELGIILALISLGISFLLSFYHFLLNLSFVGAAIIYSTPPVRLKERVYSYVCVGWASVVSLLFGVYTPIRWNLGIEHGAESISRNIPFYPDIFFICIVLFAVLSVSPLINALSDYEGDLVSNVKSVYTVYGLEEGKKIVSFLIIIMFLSPVLILGSITDFMILLPIAVLASVLFYKKGDHRPVFGLYFPVLIYSLLRYLELITV